MIWFQLQYLVHPKDAVDPRKQDGVVYEISYERSKVYIAKMGRWKHERIKEHERHVRLSRTQGSAVSEHANKTAHYLLWDEVKFIDKDPHWYSRRVKKAIQLRLHPNSINRGNRIEILEEWIPEVWIAANFYHHALLWEQFPPLIMATMLWIKTHQPWARIAIHQSLTTMVVEIVLLSKSTLNAWWRLAVVAEMSWSVSVCKSWDKQSVKPFTHIIHDEQYLSWHNNRKPLNRPIQHIVAQEYIPQETEKMWVWAYGH